MENMDLLNWEIETGFELKAKSNIEDDPMRNTALEGLMIHTVIADIASFYKSRYTSKKERFDISEKDYGLLVDKIAKRVSQKYFEKF